MERRSLLGVLFAAPLAWFARPESPRRDEYRLYLTASEMDAENVVVYLNSREVLGPKSRRA